MEIFNIMLIDMTKMLQNNRPMLSILAATDHLNYRNRPFYSCLLLLVLLFPFNSAYSLRLPEGCKNVGYQFNDPYVILNPDGIQTFYLIENTSNSTIELQKRVNENMFMSPPLTAILDKGRWAAFSSDIQNTYFQCFVHDEYDINRVNCRDVVQICQYPRVKFALSNMGNYWASVNKSQRRVIRESIKKGILLRW